jgi:alcohol dehydrogenase class IV
VSPAPGTFAFRTAGQILFGAGESRRAPALAAGFGPRVLLVTGAASLERSGVLASIREALAGLGAEVVHQVVSGEPEIDGVDATTAVSREAGCRAVLAVGGGSVIDTAKAVAALTTNRGVALDYLEDVGGGRTVDVAGLPVVAVPTTAGSGSEVTRNAVIRVPAASVKRSMRSDLLLPRVAVVDPGLSATAPVPVAAAAGLDALTHLIESYVSAAAQPMTDALALPGIHRAAGGLRALAGRVAGQAGAPGGDGGGAPASGGAGRRPRMAVRRPGRGAGRRHWPSPASGAASAWPTPGSGRSTGWRRRSAARRAWPTASPAPACWLRRSG